jgi:hypothetical protein
VRRDVVAACVIAEPRASAQFPTPPPPTRVSIDALGAQANDHSSGSSVSVDSDGSQGGYPSYSQQITPDGRYVVFQSNSTFGTTFSRCHGVDPWPCTEIYVHDRLPNSSNVNTAFGGVIRSDGPGIVVERSTYISTNTQFWAQGSSTLLSKLPLP